MIIFSFLATKAITVLVKSRIQNGTQFEQNGHCIEFHSSPCLGMKRGRSIEKVEG
jgi:hypothetical protein